MGGASCFRVEQKCHAHRVRGDFFQYLHPFTALRGIVCREAGDVAARTCETLGEATADRIGYLHEHDRDGSCFEGKGADHGRGLTKHRIGSQIDQLFC